MAKREIYVGINPRPQLEVMLEQATLTALNDRSWPLVAALAAALDALQADREQKWTATDRAACPRPAAHLPTEYTDQPHERHLQEGRPRSNCSQCQSEIYKRLVEPHLAGRASASFDFDAWWDALMERISDDNPTARFDASRGLVVHDFAGTGPNLNGPCRHCGRGPGDERHLDPIAP